LAAIRPNRPLGAISSWLCGGSQTSPREVDSCATLEELVTFYVDQHARNHAALGVPWPDARRGQPDSPLIDGGVERLAVVARESAVYPGTARMTGGGISKARFSPPPSRAPRSASRPCASGARSSGEPCSAGTSRPAREAPGQRAHSPRAPRAPRAGRLVAPTLASRQIRILIPAPNFGRLPTPLPCPLAPGGRGKGVPCHPPLTPGGLRCAAALRAVNPMIDSRQSGSPGGRRVALARRFSAGRSHRPPASHCAAPPRPLGARGSGGVGWGAPQWAAGITIWYRSSCAERGPGPGCGSHPVNGPRFVNMVSRQESARFSPA